MYRIKNSLKERKSTVRVGFFLFWKIRKFLNDKYHYNNKKEKRKSILLSSEDRYRTESLKLRNLFLKQPLHTVIEAEYGIPVRFSSMYQKLYSNLQGCLSWTWSVFTKPRRKQKSQVRMPVSYCVVKLRVFYHCWQIIIWDICLVNRTQSSPI